MRKPLRLLLVEDSADDAELVLREIRTAGYSPEATRVETGEKLVEALRKSWDIVVSDYQLPGFDALSALATVRGLGFDLPFIIVSGTIGEETAIAAMRAGAQDYLMKGSLRRLGPAIDRELEDARVRAARRQADAELRRSEERFRRLIESLDDEVFTLDADLRFDGFYGRWFGTAGDKATLMGKTVLEARGAEAGAVHAAAQGRALRGEHVVYGWAAPIDGITHHFQTSLSPMRDAAGKVTGLVGLSRDTSNERKIQEQLRISDRMVSVGTLAAGIAHEINNPLTVVMANLDFVRGEQEAGSVSGQDLKAAISDAREAADRVRQIVRDLKIFTRAEEEKSSAVDLATVLDSACRMALNEIRHRARLAKDYGQTRPVLANEARLGQVFLNLLVNAAQSIPEGRAGEHEIRVTLRERDASSVVVEVRDTGSGIPRENLARIFDPFFTTKPIGVGTGLGLAICHRIVAAFEGTIEVESTVGQGTVFRVVLPSVDSDERTDPGRARVTSARRRGRVLAIDDEPAVLAVIARILSPYHDVVIVSRAEDGLAQLRTGNAFDVLLCDLMMPEMTGMDLSAIVEQEYPKLSPRVLFLTGGAFTPRARAFLEKHARRVLEKPFEPDQLLEMVARTLESGSGSGSAPG